MLYLALIQHSTMVSTRETSVELRRPGLQRCRCCNPTSPTGVNMHRKRLHASWRVCQDKPGSRSCLGFRDTKTSILMNRTCKISWGTPAPKSPACASSFILITSIAPLPSIRAENKRTRNVTAVKSDLRKSKCDNRLFASLTNKPSHSTTSNIITSHTNIPQNPSAHLFASRTNQPSQSTTSNIITSHTNIPDDPSAHLFASLTNKPAHSTTSTIITSHTNILYNTSAHLFASRTNKPSHSTTSNIITSHTNIPQDPPAHLFASLTNKPSHSTTSNIITSHTNII